MGDVEGVEDAGVPSSLLRSCRRPVKASATSRAIADHAKVGTTSTLFLGQRPSANDMDQTPTPAHPPSLTRPALSVSSLWFSRSFQDWAAGSAQTVLMACLSGDPFPSDPTLPVC